MHRWSAGAVTLICTRLIFCHDFGVDPIPRVMADLPDGRNTGSMVESGAPLPLEWPAVRMKGSAGLERDEIMSDLQTCILGRWMHSHEEDAEGVTVYRPADYALPPSRGRRGFEFRDGGELLYGGIGRANGSELSSGHWTIEEPNRIRIEVNNERMAPFVLEVVDCSKEVLRVKQ